MTVTVELNIEFHDGTKVKCICERHWRPIVGHFWNVRGKDTGNWHGFLDTEEIADLIMEQLKVRQIDNASRRKSL